MKNNVDIYICIRLLLCKYRKHAMVSVQKFMFDS